MATKQDVANFLQKLISKIDIFGIVFRDDRGKNLQTLLDLEITSKRREEIIKDLCVNDFIGGPTSDMINEYGELWVFGKDVKKEEVYIKISLGKTNKPSVCISFHIAERKLNYKFKQS